MAKQPKRTPQQPTADPLARAKVPDNFLDRQDDVERRVRRIEEALNLGAASGDVIATRLFLTTDQGNVYELILVEITQDVNGEEMQVPTLMAEEVPS